MIKNQKVYYKSSRKKYEDSIVPKIRIANKTLIDCGFKIGDNIKVEYCKNKLIITK